MSSKSSIDYPERAFLAAKELVPKESADIPPCEVSYVDQLTPSKRLRYLVVPAKCIELWLGDETPDKITVSLQIQDSVQAILRDFWIASWRYNIRRQERRSPSNVANLLRSIDSNAKNLASSLAAVASAAREQSAHGRAIKILLEECTQVFARALGVEDRLISEYDIGALSESLQRMAAEAAWAAKQSDFIPDAIPLTRPSKTLIMQLESIWASNTGLRASASKNDNHQSPFHRFVACAFAHSNGLAASGTMRKYGVFWLEHWKPQQTPSANTINRYLAAKRVEASATK